MSSLRKKSPINARPALRLAAAQGMLILLAYHALPLVAGAQEHELMEDDIPGVVTGGSGQRAVQVRNGQAPVVIVKDVRGEKLVLQQQLMVEQLRVRRVAARRDSADRLIFGNTQGPEENRLQFEFQLKSKIEKLDKACGLSDAQKETLHLAGTGDIKRFFDEFENAREAFNNAPQNRDGFREALQHIAPLRSRLRSDLLGPRSLYGRAVKRTLTADQRARLEESVKNHWKPEFRRLVNNALKDLDRRADWDDDERRELVNLIVETARPPGNSGKFDYYVVWYYIAKLPEEKIKPYFEDRHWKLVEARMKVAGRMEDLLRRNNYIP